MPQNTGTLGRILLVSSRSPTCATALRTGNAGNCRWCRNPPARPKASNRGSIRQREFKNDRVQAGAQFQLQRPNGWRSSVRRLEGGFGGHQLKEARSGGAFDHSAVGRPRLIGNGDRVGVHDGNAAGERRGRCDVGLTRGHAIDVRQRPWQHGIGNYDRKFNTHNRISPEKKDACQAANMTVACQTAFARRPTAARWKPSMRPGLLIQPFEPFPEAVAPKRLRG